MKKAILSPLSSAFVIPGLGQIINQHLKKGVCILAGTFVLFIAALIKFYQILSAALEAENMNPSELWIYSVLDAHLTGKKIDRKQGDQL